MKLFKYSSFLLSFLSILPFSSSAQDFKKEMKAVRSTYSITPDRNIEGTNVDLGINQWGIMSPIFYHRSNDWSFGAGFRYEFSDIDFSNTTLLNESTLHSIDLPVFASYEQSESLQWIFLFNPTLSGDFDHLSGDGMNYMTMAGARYKKSESFQWIFGAFYSTGFNDNTFIPGIGFSWKPSENSDFLFAGPLLRYRYSLTDSIDLILDGKYSSNDWNTYNAGMERDLSLKTYQLTASVQWNFNDNNAVYGGVGIELAREIEIKNDSGGVLHEKDIKSAPLFEIGYRYSF
jgi:opacity protein-like surface antigen